MICVIFFLASSYELSVFLYELSFVFCYDLYLKSKIRFKNSFCLLSASMFRNNRLVRFIVLSRARRTGASDLITRFFSSTSKLFCFAVLRFRVHEGQEHSLEHRRHSMSYDRESNYVILSSFLFRSTITRLKTNLLG